MLYRVLDADPWSLILKREGLQTLAWTNNTNVLKINNFNWIKPLTCSRLSNGCKIYLSNTNIGIIGISEVSELFSDSQIITIFSVDPDIIEPQMDYILKRNN